MSLSSNWNEELRTSVSNQFYYSFNKILEGYFFFHLFFLIFLAILSIFTIILSNTNPKSIPHGITIATTIVSSFSYLTLRQFLVAKKYTQIQELIQTCKDNSFKETTIHSSWNYYVFYKNLKLLMTYQAQENFFSKRTLSPFSKLYMSIFWRFYSFAQEELNKKSLTSLLEQLSSNPSDIKLHAEYVESLFHLIEIVSIPKEFIPFFVTSAIKKLESEEHKKKLKKLYFMSIEELKILDSLNPNDPWTIALFAECYKGLQDIDREIHYTELLRKLRPQDKEILFNLGKLYFSKRHYFDGIQVYLELKTYDEILAIDLMQNYRSYLESAIYD